ncbi:MAG: enoyl-CoA hydratase-related protein [Pseudomonadota bacterium]
MLDVHAENGILTLTFNRPEAKNSLSIEVIETLTASLKNAATDDSTRVVILTGAPPLFTSGMDVKVFVNWREPENLALLKYKVPDMFHTFIDFPKPIICAVNGMGVGYGATILGICDFVIMAESAKISAPFAKLGIVPEACATHTFPRLMGRQAANWFLTSGEWMSAQACKDAGLAMEVVADDALMDVAMKRAQTLSANSLTTLMETKKMITDPWRQELHEANRLEMQRLVEFLDGPACAEGVKAFFEKRAPDFISASL